MSINVLVGHDFPTLAWSLILFVLAQWDPAAVLEYSSNYSWLASTPVAS
jgi:hypothetical protein